MISFRLFLIILTTLVCREFASSDPHLDFFDSCVAVIVLSLGFGLLIKFSAVAAVRHAGGDDAECETSIGCVIERFMQSRKSIESLWAVLLPGLLLVTGWAHWTNSLANAGWPEFLTLCLLFLPSLSLIVMTEMTAAQLEDLTAGWGNAQGERLSWPELWKLRLRLGDFSSLVLCLIPVLLIAASKDVLSGWSLGLTNELVTAISTGLAMIVILLLFPIWMGRWMGVVRIDDVQLVSKIDSLCHKAGVKRIAAVLVPSHDRWTGAAIVGWFPFFRRLWLGDGLVKQLSSEELDMVVLHEIAHVKRLHFLWRSLPIVWAAGVGIAYTLSAEYLFEDAIPFWAGRGISFALSGAVLLFGLGQVAKSCELDADREASRLAETACPWARDRPGRPAAILASALTSLLAGSPDARRRTWLHPSLHERLVSLARELSERGASSLSDDEKLPT